MKATRILSFIMALLLCVSLLPAAALADEAVPEEAPAVEETAEDPAEVPEEVPEEELPAEEPVEEIPLEETPVEEVPVEEAAPAEEPSEEIVTDGDTSGTFGDGLTWAFDSTTGVLTISGTGVMPDYAMDAPGSSSAPWNSSLSSAKSVVIENGVTSIGKYAFFFDNDVTVEIPVSVTSINSSAFVFYGSSHIKYDGTKADWISKFSDLDFNAVYCSDGLYGFDYTYTDGVLTISGEGTMPDYVITPSSEKDSPWWKCFYTVEEVVIESGPENIGAWAFRGFSKMTSVEIPATVTSIGDQAFYNCTALKTIVFDGTMAQWGKVTIGVDNTPLEEVSVQCKDGIFAPATSGTCGDNLAWELNTETGLLTISGSGAMTDFTGNSPWHAYHDIITRGVLTGAETIGKYAFMDCTALTEVSIPAGVTSIAYASFANCSSLASVALPTSVTSIGGMAFSNCGSLTEISIPAGVTGIAYAAFEACGSLASVSLPETLTSIGNYAFYSCEDLTSISMPDTVSEIDVMAFAFSGLTSVTIPAGVTSLSSNAFYGCTDLTEVHIPVNVTDIQAGAFCDCTALTDVYYDGTVAQWKAIAVGSYNGALKMATIHCSDNENYKEDLSGSCGDTATWKLENGVLTISGTGTISLVEVKHTYEQPDGTQGSYTSKEVPWSDYADYITSVVIAEGLTGIDWRVFGAQSIPNAVSMDIPSTMASISNGAIAGTKLSVINFSDTKAQWETICNSANNIRLKMVTVKCTNGEIVPDISGTCGENDNAKWKLDPATGELTISGTGAVTFSGSDVPWSDYISYIKTITIEEGITEVSCGKYSLAAYYTGVKSISLPISLVTIGEGTFQYFWNLSTVTYAGTKEDWASVTIGSDNDRLLSATLKCAPSRYTVSFDANGGSGAPESQTKIEGQALTLSDTVPTRSGYTFLGWAITADAKTASYTAGGSYTADAAATLYAVWKQSCGEGLDWTFDSTTGTLTISGKGAMDDFDSKPDSEPWSEFADDITSIVIKDGVTNIGDYAFNTCKALKTVTIAASVTTVGYDAFIGYYLYIDNGCNTEFNFDGTKAQWAAVKDESTTLNRCAVHCKDGVYGFTYSYLNGTLTISGEGDMPAYVSIEPGELTPWFYLADETYKVVIGEDVTGISAQAFAGCTNLRSITIPEAVTSIGDGVFSNCTSLSTVNFDGTVEEWKAVAIGTNNDVLDDAVIVCSDGRIAPPPSGTCGDDLQWTLDEETGLLTISGSGKMTDYTEKAPWYTYRNDITGVALTGAESIGSNAFANCTAITEISLPDTVTAIGQMAFSGCGSLENVSIPTGVTSIAYGTFEFCDSLETVSIPATVTSIDRAAFYECASLTEVTIPDDVETISANTFTACTSLTKVHIPDSVTSIETAAFDGCCSLAEVDYDGTTEQWKAITIGSYNTCLAMASIHCSDDVYTAEINGQCSDSVTWTLKDGVLTISGKGVISMLEEQVPSGPQTMTVYTIPWEEYSAYIKSIVIEEGITEIATGVFQNIANAVSMDIPATLTTIQPDAVGSAYNLITVNYGGTKTQWDAITIGDGNTRLKMVTVNCNGSEIVPDLSGDCGDSATWSLDPVSGVLTISGTGAIGSGTLVTDGAAEDNVPDNTYVAPWAEYAEYITSIVVEEGITSICENAFGGENAYDSVTSVSLPKTLETVGEDAFASCPVLETVEYAGTEEAWTAIATSGGNTHLVVADIIYAPAEYTVSFDANGGTGAPASQTKIEGKALTLSSTVPTRTGYSFLGWAADKTAAKAEYAAGGSYTANADVTLYALWKADTYTVTFNANGGDTASVPAAQTKTHDAALTLSSTVPTRTGYSFLGWAADKTAAKAEYAAGGSYTANANVTLYAVWALNTVTVSFDANGGSGAPAAQTKAVDAALTLSSTVPTRDGYSFLGWAADKTAETAEYTAGGTYTANADVTLYAVWVNVAHEGTGWEWYDGSFYYFNDSQILTSAWAYYNDNWYYLDENGQMITGVYDVPGYGTYYCSDSGVMQTSCWTWQDGEFRYFGSDGRMVKNDWLLYNGSWFYMDDTGAMVTGVYTVPGDTAYCFADNGAMQTGAWTWTDGSFYYFGSDGRMVTANWVWYAGGWYYMDKTGAMVTGVYDVPGDTTYSFADSGKLNTSCWLWADGGFCYFGTDGRMVKNAWLWYNGSWYYMNANGVMVTGTVDVPGCGKCNFNSSGVWTGYAN